MTDETKSQSFSDIWSISDSIIEKNKQVKKDVFYIPDEDKIINNVKGFVINSVGNIVAQFGFFIETEGKERIDFKISPDGFMSSVYNKPTNILLGYGHPLGFNGMVDPSQSNVLHLGPDQANGEQFVISVENDDKLKEQGMVCMIRDTDVMTELLPEEVREDFELSLEDASKPVEDLNELETSYNEYMRHLYNILGERFNKLDNVKPEMGDD